MASLRSFSSMVLGSFLVIAAGCAEDSVTDESLQDLPVETTPMGGPVGVNNLAPDCLWDQNNLHDLFLLGQGPLRDVSGKLVDTPLLLSSCGERVLDYTLRCALPYDETISTVAGVKYPGNFGLAEAWLDAPLAVDARGWITACVVQHLNGLDAVVPIMLDGDHKSLEPQPGSNYQDFVVEESTMFGNFFLDAPSPLGPPPVYACSEKEFTGICGTAASEWVEKRICGKSSYCGLVYLGQCDEIPNCSDTPEGFWVCDDGDGHVYTDTIRSYLTATGAAQRYESCY